MIELKGEKKVRIENTEGYTHIFIDGEEIRRVREISFHQSVDEFPVVELTVYGIPSIDIDANVEVNYMPDEYLKWLNEMIEENERDKGIFKMCRARYLSYFGRPYENIDIIP